MTSPDCGTAIPYSTKRCNLRLSGVELVIGRLPSFTGHRFRTYALRAAGVSAARSTLFWGMPQLVGPGDVCSRLTIGVHSGFNVGCYFGLDDTIQIGNHVSVGHDVMFLTRTYATGPTAQRAGASICAPIVVEDGVWLGARCTIMPGVRIGAGAVVGAAEVVAQDIAADTMLVGGRVISVSQWRK
jgi:maltose O-acetyltransferase